MPRTSTVELVDLQDLLPLVPGTGTTVGSAALNLSLVKANVKAPFSVNAGPEIAFVVQAGAELTMRAINKGNEDPDRIVALKETKTPSGELPPQMKLSDDHSWLKYRVEAQASASASVDAGWFAAGIGASGTVVTNDYRRHAHDTVVLSGVEVDVRNGPRFAVSLDDVINLGEGDAVSLHVGGELLARISVSWSDIFTSQLGTLTRAISSTAPIGIKATVAAKVQASVKLIDRFTLVFSRLDATRWRVGLKKADIKQVDFGAQVGVTVEIDNKEEISRVLDGVVGDLLGKSFAQIQGLLAKSSIGEDDLQTFADVFRRLGLGNGPTLADVKQALDRLQSDVRERIETMLKEKIALGFSYEYRRVSSDTVLLQALVTRAALEEHHAELKRGHFRGLIDSVIAEPSGVAPRIEIEQYLNEKKVTTDRAWGFSLGIGKWKLTGRDRRSVVAVRRTTVDGLHEQRSYQSLGAYEGNVFGEKQAWHVDFVAEMPQFSANQVPRFAEYQFGLSLGWEERNRTFDDLDAEQAVDFAALWGICGHGDTRAVEEMLAPFRGKKGVEWSVHLRVNDEALRAIAPVLAASDRTQFAGAMAASMRGRKKVGGVAGVGRRRTLYEPVWAFYLGAPNVPSGPEVSRFAQNLLRNQEPAAASDEEKFLLIDRLLTAAGTCELNPSTRMDADDFLRGIQKLAVAMGRNDADLDVVSQAYKSMVKLWTQSHHVRSLGVRIVDVARQVNKLKGVERTLTVRLEDTSVSISSNPVGTV